MKEYCCIFKAKILMLMFFCSASMIFKMKIHIYVYINKYTYLPYALSVCVGGCVSIYLKYSFQ